MESYPALALIMPSTRGFGEASWTLAEVREQLDYRPQEREAFAARVYAALRGWVDTHQAYAMVLIDAGLAPMGGAMVDLCCNDRVFAHMVARGMDVCQVDEGGDNALHKTIHIRTMPAFERAWRAMLEAGLDPICQNRLGHTPLDLLRARPELVPLAEQCISSFQAKTLDQGTPLPGPGGTRRL